MSRITSFARTAGLAAAMLGSVSLSAEDGLKVKDTTNYLMSEQDEIALSRSAGPAAVSADASILVMNSDGSYREAVKGSNGWTCLTGRSWTGPAPVVEGKRQWSANHFNPSIRAPQCFNAEAQDSLVALHKLTSKMFMSGAGTKDVDLAIGQSLGGGQIEIPEAGAMSYMISPNQVLTPNGGRFMPHLMLYTPFATQANYGTRDRTMTVPMVAEAGSAWATTVVVVPFWSDGSPAMGN